MKLKKISHMLLSSSIFFPLTALAYEPDNHISIMDSAIDLYNYCSTSSVTEESRVRLLQGDEALDVGLMYVTPYDRYQMHDEDVFFLTWRTINWHFYNPDLTAYSRKGAVEQSHQRLWEGLIEGYASNSGKYKQFFLGGIAHLLEDITVPAHVAPVYHGPTEIIALSPDFMPLVDYMVEHSSENVFSISDGVDEMQVDDQALMESMKTESGVCEGITTGSDDLEAIREASSRETLARLQTSIPGCAGVTWQTFWTPPEQGEYFGRYNIANNNPTFGESGTLYNGASGSCTFTSINGQPDQRYVDFAEALHKQAIKYNMKLLELAKNNPNSLL